MFSINLRITAHQTEEAYVAWVSVASRPRGQGAPGVARPYTCTLRYGAVVSLGRLLSGRVPMFVSFCVFRVSVCVSVCVMAVFAAPPCFAIGVEQDGGWGEGRKRTDVRCTGGCGAVSAARRRYPLASLVPRVSWWW